MSSIFNKKNLRLIAGVLLVIYIILLFVNPVTAEDEQAKSNDEPTKPERKITKLQIGIKKKVEDCTRRSKSNDVLHIHYEGKLLNGEVFDSSYGRGEPLTFTLGAGQVIKGWDQGLIGICEGEKRKLIIPSDLAYGSKGAGPKIPPDSALIFEVECVKIEGPKSDL